MTEGLNSARIQNPKAQVTAAAEKAFESAGLNSSTEETKIEDLAKDAEPRTDLLRMERQIVTTSAACPARLVPTGDKITIPKGVFVTLTSG